MCVCVRVCVYFVDFQVRQMRKEEEKARQLGSVVSWAPHHVKIGKAWSETQKSEATIIEAAIIEEVSTPKKEKKTASPRKVCVCACCVWRGAV